jgi:hypothetical protein
VRRAHPVREAGGSSSHVRVFEQIAVGTRPKCRPDTLSWLMQHDLITDSVLNPAVTQWAHVAWCEWCATSVDR